MTKRKKWTDTIHPVRVVIIEWLRPDETRTGEELCKRLEEWRPRKRVELCQCDSAESVLSALDHLTNSVPHKGVPILHVESHGAGGPDGGISGNDKELLTWRQLRAPLRALNLATRFQLLIVGAACYGDGFIWGIGEIAASPFVACVGFRQSVGESSLFAVMLEFYRALLLRDENVEDAVESALREAHDPKSEILRYTPVRSLLLEAIRRDFEREAAMSEKERFARNVSLAAKSAIQRGRASRYSMIAASETYASEASANVMVNSILALDIFPENRKRFGIDVRELLREARKTRDSRAETRAAAPTAK